MTDEVINALNHSVHALFSSPDPTLRILCLIFCVALIIGSITIIALMTDYIRHSKIAKRICLTLLAVVVLISGGTYLYARHYQSVTAKTQQTVLREYADEVPEITVVKTRDDQTLIYKGIVDDASVFVEKPELMIVTKHDPTSPHFEHGRKMKNFEIKDIQQEDTLKFLTHWWKQLTK